MGRTYRESIVAVIRSFEYSGLIQSREVEVLLYILLANIQNA